MSGSSASAGGADFMEIETSGRSLIGPVLMAGLFVGCAVICGPVAGVRPRMRSRMDMEGELIQSALHRRQFGSAGSRACVPAVIGTVVFARDLPQVAVVAVLHAAAAQLARDHLRLRITPGVATALGEGYGLSVAHRGL